MNIHNRLGLIEGVESMLSHEQRMNQISNNLANVDTTGYRKENVTFWEMLYNVDDNRQRVGKGLKVITDHSQGVTKLTGNPLDLAISGKGFFKVQSPQGVRYTRDGNFHLNSDRQLTTSNGFPVLGEGGSITVTGTDIAVGRNGAVIVDGVEAARLSIVSVNDETLLEKDGLNLFKLDTASGSETVAEEFEVQQGYLEASNVNSVIEMTEMLDMMRSFEAQQRIVRTIDDIDGQAAGRVGRLTP